MAAGLRFVVPVAVAFEVLAGGLPPLPHLHRHRRVARTCRQVVERLGQVLHGPRRVPRAAYCAPVGREEIIAHRAGRDTRVDILARHRGHEVVGVRPVRGRTPVRLLAHSSGPPMPPVPDDGGELVVRAARRVVQRGDGRARHGSENREVVRLTLPRLRNTLELPPGDPGSGRSLALVADLPLGVRPPGAGDVVLTPVVPFVQPFGGLGAARALRAGDEVVGGSVACGTAVLLPWPGRAGLDPELRRDVAALLGVASLMAARRSFGGW